MKLLIILPVFILAILFSCNRNAETLLPAGDDDKLYTIPSVTVQEGKLTGEITRSGQVSGVSETEIISEVSGRITAIYKKTGENVNTGDIIAETDSKIEKAAMESARQEYITASAEEEGFDALNKKGQISKIDLEKARSRTKAARLRLLQAEKAYNDCFFRSPQDGILAELYIEKNRYVTRGMITARVVDNTSFIIRTYLDENNINFITEGMPVMVRITSAYSGRFLSGRVREKALSVNPATGTYSVSVIFEDIPERKIISGMSASVVFEADEELHPVIPAMAVFPENGEEYVYVISDSKAVKRKIKTSGSFSGRTSVTEGLKENELLSLKNLTALPPDAEIKTADRGSSLSWE